MGHDILITGTACSTSSTVRQPTGPGIEGPPGNKFHHVSLSSGKTFRASSGKTILDAALSTGIALEHSCKTGRCGACRAHVKSGSTAAIFDESGLSRSDKEAGLILTCAREAASDLELEIDDLGGIPFRPACTLPCRISSLSRLSQDVVGVTLRFPPGRQVEYLPGQYVDVIGKGGLCRSYSIANAPLANGEIELHIRRVPGGAMSRYWFEEARINDLLRLNGPKGTFFIRDIAGTDLILMATGTGIAPIKAMLEGMSQWPEERLPHSIRLYWGVRTASDLYWHPSEIKLALDYYPVLSRKDVSWSGLCGYVHHAVLETVVSLESAAVYACGSLAMIEHARAGLANAGLEARRFHSDAFVSSGLVSSSHNFSFPSQTGENHS